jgi:hypothetical protein
LKQIILLFYTLLFIVVIISCGKKLLSPTTVFSEQNVSLIPNTFTISEPYKFAPYDLPNEMKRVKTNYLQMKEYAKKNKCNTNYVFVIDMRIPSFKKRFFVYNSLKDSIINSGLVAHGVGTETYKGYLIFSNTPDSRMTSLGKYKVGESYNGLYGFSYRLRGLDSTNNKALQRGIVLHSYQNVPDEKTTNYPLILSYGCPMVSTNFFENLKGYISKDKKPIMLSIIY